jgi:hypothetical protein
VARLGMLGLSNNWPNPPDMQQPACTNTTENWCPEVVHPREYEFIISVIDVHGTVSSRLDTEHHAAASICYDMSAHFDVEAGFKQGRISSLLQGNELSQIKEAHEAAGVPWMHPADDEAILSSLRDKKHTSTQYMNKDQKTCAVCLASAHNFETAVHCVCAVRVLYKTMARNMSPTCVL